MKKDIHRNAVDFIVKVGQLFMSGKYCAEDRCWIFAEIDFCFMQLFN